MWRESNQVRARVWGAHGHTSEEAGAPVGACARSNQGVGPRWGRRGPACRGSDSSSGVITVEVKCRRDLRAKSKGWWTLEWARLNLERTRLTRARGVAGGDVWGVAGGQAVERSSIGTEGAIR